MTFISKQTQRAVEEKLYGKKKAVEMAAKRKRNSKTALAQALEDIADKRKEKRRRKKARKDSNPRSRYRRAK